MNVGDNTIGGHFCSGEMFLARVLVKGSPYGPHSSGVWGAPRFVSDFIRDDEVGVEIFHKVSEVNSSPSDLRYTGWFYLKTLIDIDDFTKDIPNPGSSWAFAKSFSVYDGNSWEALVVSDSEAKRIARFAIHYANLHAPDWHKGSSSIQVHHNRAVSSYER